MDGLVQDPFKFQLDSFDDELGTGLTKMINTVDTVVLGPHLPSISWEFSIQGVRTRCGRQQTSLQARLPAQDASQPTQQLAWFGPVLLCGVRG